MKIYLTILLLLATSMVFSQSSFYYYQGEKVFLKERKDRLLLKLSEDANKPELLKMIQADLTLQITSKLKSEEMMPSFVVLESRTKGDFPLSTISNYLNNRNVISALPMLEYSDGQIQGLTNEFIVKLKANTTLEQFTELLNQKKCSIVGENDFVPNQFLISVSKASRKNSLECANFFYESGLVEFAEPNFFREGITQSNDPLFGYQWPLKNFGQSGGMSGADIGIERAWAISEGRPDIHVAVVDQGIDLNHPDLSANLLPGYDATGYGTLGGPLSGEFHGTACAGIIAAIKDNGIGIAGVAPKCKIIPVHASFGYGQTDQWLADGIEWAWNPMHGNADVISNSWGGGSPSTAITNAVTNATTQGRGGLGTVVLFSSGNNYSSVSFPATLPNVIAVGASSFDDTRESYSNFGSALDVVAPGGNSNIYTTDIVGPLGYSSSDYTSTFAGTSAACPHAAGVCVLILSVNRCLTAAQVTRILELSCDKVGGLYCYGPGGTAGFFNNEMGYGRINAFKALQYANSQSTSVFQNIAGTDVGASNVFAWAFVPNMFVTCTNWASGTYFVRRHEIRATVPFSNVAPPSVVGSSNGFSAANPNRGTYYFELFSFNQTSLTVRTWVYEIVSSQGQLVGWLPTSPANVRFNFTAMRLIPSELFFQNQIVTATSIEKAMNRIVAGRNITNSVPVGDYVLQSVANVKFHAGNEILLSPGFFAGTGSNFEATVAPFFTCQQYPMGQFGNFVSSLADVEIFEQESNYQTSLPDTNQDQSPSKVIGKEAAIEQFPQVVIFPNPCSTTLNIQLVAKGSADIEIFDLFGRTLFHTTGIQAAARIDLSFLSQGTYFLTVSVDDRIITRKFLKQ
jgi:subtilisin family serine protease